MSAILQIEDLTHTFPNGVTAVNEVNLQLERGQFTILAGVNGSGKTVLIKHFNGLLMPTKGRVLFGGEPISKNLLFARQRIGLIFQDTDSQIVGQTVVDDVAFGPENLCLSREEIKKRVDLALQSVGLEDFAQARPHTLSGGQKRRLAVAGILAMAPQLIVFDEPFTGLDYPGVRQVLRQIVDLHQNGHTIVVVTHDLEKVLAHADRLLIMEKGRIVRDGEPEAIIDEVEKFGIRRPYGLGRRVETMTWLS